MFHFQKGATANLLKDLKTEEKVKEEEYQRVTEGNEGYVETLMEANELVARLETRLKLELDSRHVLKCCQKERLKQRLIPA